MNEQHANLDQDSQHDFSSDQAPSKSSLKREAKQAFVLAQKLLQTQSGRLRKLPLDEPIIESIAQGQTIRSHGARKRHTQHLAKLLRNSGLVETITDLLEQPDGAAGQVNNSEKNEVHEQLLQTMLSDFTAGIGELQQLYPSIEIQNVRQLIRQMQNAQAKSNEDGADKKHAAVFQRARKHLLQLLRDQASR